MAPNPPADYNGQTAGEKLAERRPFSAGVGSAQPWTPKPGDALTDEEKAELLLYDSQRQATASRKAAVRRYLLVLLLTFIGSALGSMMTILTLSYYH